MVGQHPGVFLLVVGRYIGGGHQHRRLGDGGQLRDGGGTRPAQHQVGRRHNQGHIIDILPHLNAAALQLQPLPGNCLYHPAVIPARTVDMVPRRTGVTLVGDKVYHLMVHSLRPKGTPVGQQQGAVVRKPQLLPGLLAGVLEEISPHRSAGDHHLRGVVVVAAALLKANHHPVYHLGQGLGGQAGHRIGLMHRGRDPPLGRRIHNGVRGISPRTHHQVGLELIQNGFRLSPRLLHIDQRPQVVGDVRRSQGAVEVGDGHRLDAVALLGHQTGLHPPIGPHKEDLRPRLSLLKNAGQRHCRVDVSGGPAAGK